MLTKTIRVLGGTYLVLALAFIVFNYGAIWYFQGFWALTEILSPFNIINWIVTVATLLPGILLLVWADKRDANSGTNA